MTVQVDPATGEIRAEGPDQVDLQGVTVAASLTSYSYPDYEANDLALLAESLKFASVVACCGRYSSMGRCPDGSEFRKVLICRRDWCRSCGAPWSDAHRRRFVDWLPNIRQIRRMGYLVITVPEEHRPRTKRELAAMGRAVTQVMKDWRFPRGVRRWHFFGDLWVAYWQQLDPELKRETAEAKYGEKTPDEARSDGVVPKWHPHLNILVDGESIPTEHDAFVAWSTALRESLAETLGCPVNMHYEWADDAAQKVHIAKYVLRSTFLDCEWDSQAARELHGFRNTRWWGGAGAWDADPVWEMGREAAGDSGAELEIRPELEALHSGTCPCCDQAVKWGGIERTALYRQRVIDDYGGGYYRVKLDVFDSWDSQPDPDTAYQPPG